MPLATVLLLMTVTVALAQPAPHRDITQYTLPPDKLAKAEDYAAARNRLHFEAVAWGFLVLGGVLTCKLGPRFRNLAERVSQRRLVQAYVFGTALLLTVDVLELPPSIYGHHLSLSFGQSVEGWGAWFWDWTKGELLVLAAAGLVLWILYGAIRRSPRRWWFYFWLASVPMVVAVVFVEPVLIEPLFFRFEPLAKQHPSLAADIQAVAVRGGLAIPENRMFVMNASTKYVAPNAYVTGIGASKRVVVWDTALQQLTTNEVLVVFGHEMGHYVLGHMWIGMAGGFIGSLMVLFLGYHGVRWALKRWGDRWSISGMPDWASLPVLLLAVAILGFLGEPIQNGFSRVLEHDADIYGLEVIHGIVPNAAQVAAHDFQVEGEAWLADPHPSPFIVFWLYDHPPISERLHLAATYDPWDKGQQPRYVK
jgi:STE24 endopeptidase